ncbi:MAG: hypothetical protein GF350_12355 [Chitinivibrionales bacterium]|nr:hypothetical protein [Chitinivibrionales bacterium]
MQCFIEWSVFTLIAQSQDTAFKSEKTLIDLIRTRSIPQRIRSARSLSASVISLARKGIQKAYPHLSQQERDFRFLALHYGDELARSWKKYMESMRNETA